LFSSLGNPFILKLSFPLCPIYFFPEKSKTVADNNSVKQNLPNTFFFNWQFFESVPFTQTSANPTQVVWARAPRKILPSVLVSYGS
jgi:hypothetical protein